MYSSVPVDGEYRLVCSVEGEYRPTIYAAKRESKDLIGLHAKWRGSIQYRPTKYAVSGGYSDLQNMQCREGIQIYKICSVGRK